MPSDIRVYSAGPLTIIALLVIIGLIVIVVPLLFLGLVGKAFTNLVGLSWITATALVILILLCSLVNIPVWKIRKETIRMPHSPDGQFPDAFSPNETGGLWETSITVNLGGAIIPVAMACYLLYRASAVMDVNTLYLQVTCRDPHCRSDGLRDDPAHGGDRAPGAALCPGPHGASLWYPACRRVGAALPLVLSRLQRDLRHFAGCKYCAPAPCGRSRSAAGQYWRGRDVWRDLYRVHPVGTYCMRLCRHFFL